MGCPARVVLQPRTRIARRLRREATEVEKRLWLALRGIGTAHRFRRQHPIGSYIADFACPSRKLAIELDGGQHALNEIADTLRTQELARRGYRVLRFWNNDVTENIAGVLEIIRLELEREGQELSLSALQGGEGGARREAMGG